MEQHHWQRERRLKRSYAANQRDAGERGSVSVTGIVIFFLLLFTMAIGTNWVDNALALGLCGPPWPRRLSWFSRGRPGWPGSCLSIGCF